MNFDDRPVGRPGFLTVLCILTFIYSSYNTVSSTLKYFTADKTAAEVTVRREKAMNDIKAKAGKADDPGARFAEKLMNNLAFFTPDNIRRMSLGSIASSVFCLLGAFFMWKLKRNGYYLYLVGTLAGIVIPFILFGPTNLLALGMSIFIGFFGLVFLILYGVNLKHMK